MHQLTDLPDEVSAIARYRDRNHRIRTEGTRNLLAAADAAAVGRFLAQSIAWTPAGAGDIIAEHERLVLEAGGVVIRYARSTGPAPTPRTGCRRHPGSRSTRRRGEPCRCSRSRAALWRSPTSEHRPWRRGFLRAREKARKESPAGAANPRA